MCKRFEGGGARRKLRLAAYSILAVLLSIPLGLHAQQYSGSITGSVADSTGAAIPGATVTVINVGTGAKVTQKSGGDGGFTFAQLPVGTYEVQVNQANFKQFVETGVVVHTSTPTEVPVVMQIGQVSQKVTVAANAVQVQTTSAAVGEVVTSTQVHELPLNGENFVGLTQLSPGVSAAQDANFEGKGLQGVDFSVNGNPYNENLFLVDGVNDNDVGSGRTILIYPSVDTIAEFKMIRNSYGPEYGQAAGAIISITTKSGANQFHGGFFYAGRNDALDANDWFSNHNGTGKAEERRNDFGYYIAGPVVKDKLFFWWNQEWNKEITGHSYATCVPTAAEEGGDFRGYGTNMYVTQPDGTQKLESSSGGDPYTDQCGASVPVIPAYDQGSDPNIVANPDAGGLTIAKFYPTGPTTVDANGNNWSESVRNKLDWNEWNVRGDYQITSGERATFRWTQDSWKNPGPNSTTYLWGDAVFPTLDSSWSQPSKSVMAKLSSTLSSTLVNDVEFGWGYNAIITSNAGSEANLPDQLATTYPATFPQSIKTPGEWFGWGGLDDYAGNLGNNNYLAWNIAPYGDREDLYSIQDNLSKVWGNHLIKAGVLFDTNDKVEDSGDGADRPTFPSYSYSCTICTGNELTNMLLPGTGPNAQMFTGVTENSIDGIADIHWRDIEPYIGDTWKITRNVTLDFGIRWSFLREPFAGSKGGNTRPSYDVGSNYPNQLANWSKAHWSAAEAAANSSDVCNGLLTVPGTSPCQDQEKFLQSLGVTNFVLSNGTPGPNASLVKENNHSIAPRVGIAWDVFGNGKTALRFGGGQFFAREPVGPNEQLAFNAPFELGINTTRSLDTPSPLSVATVSPHQSKVTGGFLSNTWQWNATVEQQLAPSTTLEVSYVGNTGVHLTSMYDANAIPAADYLVAAFAPGADGGSSYNGGGCLTQPGGGVVCTGENQYRPANNFAEVGGFAREGHASYHSLQTLFRMQTGNYSTFQAAYTWSHSIGNVDLDNSSGTQGAEATTDLSNPGLDKGNTNINRPNIFVANEVLFLPKLTTHGAFVQNTLGGWETNSIINVAEGSSLTIYTAGASGAQGSTLGQLVGTGYNGNNRPLVTNVGCNTHRSGDQIINLSHFTLLGYPLGTFPANMEHRGDCYGAPYTDVDFQLAKNWNFKEKYRIKFSMDFFNLFNHPNFNSANLEGSNFTANNLVCGPGGTTCTPTNNVVSGGDWPGAPGSPSAGFGQASTLHGTARQLQYTLRFSF